MWTVPSGCKRKIRFTMEVNKPGVLSPYLLILEHQADFIWCSDSVWYQQTFLKAANQKGQSETDSEIKKVWMRTENIKAHSDVLLQRFAQRNKHDSLLSDFVWLGFDHLLVCYQVFLFWFVCFPFLLFLSVGSSGVFTLFTLFSFWPQVCLNRFIC